MTYRTLAVEQRMKPDQEAFIFKNSKVNGNFSRSCRLIHLCRRIWSVLFVPQQLVYPETQIFYGWILAVSMTVTVISITGIL